MDCGRARLVLIPGNKSSLGKYWETPKLSAPTKSAVRLRPPLAVHCAETMYVIKRDGRQEKVRFDKITARIQKLSYGLNDTFCDPTVVAQKVCMGVYKGVTTSQLDELAAETAAGLTASHPDYALVGRMFNRVVVSSSSV